MKPKRVKPSDHAFVGLLESDTWPVEPSLRRLQPLLTSVGNAKSVRDSRAVRADFFQPLISPPLWVTCANSRRG